MTFDFKGLKDKAAKALKEAQTKAAEAKEKLAPYAEQAGKAIVKADKVINEKVDEAREKLAPLAEQAKDKIVEAVKKGRGPK